MIKAKCKKNLEKEKRNKRDEKRDTSCYLLVSLFFRSWNFIKIWIFFGQDKDTKELEKFISALL